MLNVPMDILKFHPIRRTKEQKEAFQGDILAYVRDLGYEAWVEQAGKKAQNIIIGNPQNAKYMVTAHYDTPASIGIPNVLTPCNLLTFILWQVLVIGGLLVTAIASGAVTYLLTHSKLVMLLVAYVVYFGILGLMMFGPANKSNVNDNSSGVVTVLEIARTLQENQRNKVCFILFDLEESGLVGSKGYRKAHKAATENQIVLNLDCVGDGDSIIFFPSKKLKKDASQMANLKRCGGWFGFKHITIHEKGFANYPSDHVRFPLGVGVGAFHEKNGKNPCLKRIHTVHDTVLDETNVNILRACISTLISMQ